MPSDMAECSNPCIAPNKAQQEWKRATGRASQHRCRAWAAHTRHEDCQRRLQRLVKLYKTPLTARAIHDGKYVKHVACWLVKLDLLPLCTAKTVLSKQRVILLRTPPSLPPLP